MNWLYMSPWFYKLKRFVGPYLGEYVFIICRAVIIVGMLVVMFAQGLELKSLRAKVNAAQFYISTDMTPEWKLRLIEHILQQD